MMSQQFTLADFVSWAETELRDHYPQSSLTICEPSSNSAAFIEIDTNEVVSRLTFWTSGGVSAEVLSATTSEQIYSADGKVNSREDFGGFFSDFQQALSGLPSH